MKRLIQRRVSSGALRLGWGCAVLAVGMLAVACGKPDEGVAPVEAGNPFDLHVILRRCVELHQNAKTLHAVGTLRDYRGEQRIVAPIGWDIGGPSRCRLQIDMDVSWILDDEWWTYERATQRYSKHAFYTGTPIETASFVMSHEIEFLLPRLLRLGERTFGGRDGRFEEWTVQGVAWQGDRPCYVLTRIGRGATAGQVQRLWVDQDSFVLRGWAFLAPGGEGGRENVIVGCTYYEMELGKELSSEAFSLTTPRPILLPRHGDGEE